MEITLHHKDKKYIANLSKPFDISIPLEEGLNTVNCFYAPPMEVTPVVMGDFIGATALGGIVNFMNVKINPHGNGTHTECVGHIAKKKYTINDCLNEFHFIAKLISIYPTNDGNGDRIITKEQIMELLDKNEAKALIIRTLPNYHDKLKRHYSHTNPPYIHHEAMDYIVQCGIEHLLVDLPSVDREEDEGKLLGHRSFWQYPDAVRKACTITELIFVGDSIKDDLYLLNIQIASFEIDVSPSKPVLYSLI